MKSLVVYDSYFGNTQKIAEVIGGEMKAKIVRVAEVKPDDLKDIQILVVGSPTRAFRPTKATVDFLNNLPVLKNVKVAAFDTRSDLAQVNSKLLSTMVGFFGYAAEPMVKILVKKGGELAASAAGFMVGGIEGPLLKGEIERARKFAKEILK